MSNSAVDYSSEYDQYLSFVDLERDAEWNVAWKAQNQKKVEELLYKYGCEIDYGYEIEVCLHRPRTSNSVDYGPRISFKSRTDKEWQKNMSVEDLIACSSSFVKGELMGMNRQSNFTGDAMSKYGCNEVDVEINDTIKE